VTLARQAWTLDVVYPAVVEPGEAETLTVTVSQGGAPIDSAWIEVDVASGFIGGHPNARGGVTSATQGKTNAQGQFVTSVGLSVGESQVSIEMRAYAAPGGTLQAEQTVVATAAGLPMMSTLVGVLEFNGVVFHAELEMTLDSVSDAVQLRACEGQGFGGPGDPCRDFHCDSLWEGTLVGDQLTATMVNHNGPCAIGQPGQNRLDGCEITATLSQDPDGTRRLTGGGDGSFFSCFSPGNPDTTFEVCEPDCGP
jgi:hypothetical protein